MKGLSIPLNISFWKKSLQTESKETRRYFLRIFYHPSSKREQQCFFSIELGLYQSLNIGKK